MKEGKLIGNIIYQEGIKIYPKRVKAIRKIELSGNKVEVQSFMEKVNFLRIFIAPFAETVKYITNMNNIPYILTSSKVGIDILLINIFPMK